MCIWVRLYTAYTQRDGKQARITEHKALFDTSGLLNHQLMVFKYLICIYIQIPSYA